MEAKLIILKRKQHGLCVRACVHARVCVFVWRRARAHIRGRVAIIGKRITGLGNDNETRGSGLVERSRGSSDGVFLC